jgi:tRNA-Thr(GGU) m(6)t(6)A37 methyltransferase TsaA
MGSISMYPIGVIHSPFQEKGRTPIQASRSSARGSVELELAFEDGLQDLEGFSHIILLYVFDRLMGYTLRVKPFLDKTEHGLFATRFPARPNPIGLSIVSLLAIHDNILDVQGIDVLDGTPLLDIKPYIPEFDLRTDVRTGWYETRSKL